MKIKLLTMVVFAGFNGLAQVSSLQDIVSAAENYQKQLPRENFIFISISLPIL
jgi:hypothetical protein